MRDSVIRLVHICLILVLPRRLPRSSAPYWLYYDGPTIALSFFSSRGRLGESKSWFRQLAIGGLGGLFYSQVSRKIFGLPIRMKTERLSDWLLIPTAISEEIIWRGKTKTAVDGFASILGFAFLHHPLGGLRAVLHMGIFATVAQLLRSRHGLGAAATFHVVYNLFR